MSRNYLDKLLVKYDRLKKIVQIQYIAIALLIITIFLLVH